jgi:protein-tyrosine phosphatase
LPDTAVHEVQDFLTYAPGERSTYLKVRLSNGLGLVKLERTPIPLNVRSIVFVCFGNIIRSPACEAMMKQALMGVPDVQIAITSAGLNATPGRSAHPWAITAARRFGVSLEQHRARLLTADLVAQADLIFAMDYRNQVQLLSRWKASRNKVFMLSAYAGGDYRDREIHDPYNLGLEETQRCYDVLSTCVRNLVSSLSKGAAATR